MMTPNLAAFLGVIAHAEGTDRASDPYRVCYGFYIIKGPLTDHPTLTGEWMGAPLDSLGPAYVGLKSTAAGKYQITVHTWEALKEALSLPDFMPASQDAAAGLLIQQKGALALVEAGRFAAAVDLCAGVWASLPGSISGQPQAKLAALQSFYTSNGGVLA